jgi:4-diphosphocytidyl-2C-methyl-D-erythritol kinase
MHENSAYHANAIRDSKVGNIGHQLGVDIAWLLTHEKGGQKKGVGEEIQQLRRSETEHGRGERRTAVFLL